MPANEQQHSEPRRRWQILTACFDLAGVFYFYLRTSWSQALRPLWKIWRCYAYSDLLISLVLGNRSSIFFCIFFFFLVSDDPIITSQGTSQGMRDMIFLQEPVELKCNSPLMYTAVSRKVFLQTGKSLRENVERSFWVMVVFTVAWLNLKAF